MSNHTNELPGFEMPDQNPDKGPVTCLGMTFDNDDERRKHFTEELRTKLQDPEFRKIEGFPIGEDDDILALSDPPYYTACPNPWLADFIAEWETQKPKQPEGYRYHREPFASDVSEGKTHAIYKAHSYHTKVPHLAIIPSILHYTKPGDIVLDGFNGSGMTGVAAQWCGSAPAEYRKKLESDWKKEGHPAPEWGLRHCVLNDLSPTATFIASNYNLPFDVNVFAQAAKKLLKEVKDEIGWMYETTHADGKTKAMIDYTVWSEVFTCPECTGEVVFLNEALDEDSKKVADEFPCPECGALLSKSNLERRFETVSDKKLDETWKHITFRPALICYKIGKQKYEKVPDQNDLDVLRRIVDMDLPLEIPADRFPVEKMYHGSRIAPKGFTHIHHFFLPRAAQALGLLWKKAKAHPDARIRHMLMFWTDSHLVNLSIQNRHRPHVSFPYNPLNGVYYVSSLISEASPFTAYQNKLKSLQRAWSPNWNNFDGCIATGTAAHLQIEKETVDYVYTDPPFGENIYYADLNFFIESWYKVFSNTDSEAIVDKAKKKGLAEYQSLMRFCFAEYYRVLKPGRWITIVFHNSRNAVWNAIQEALQMVGFVVADVRTLDKEQGSYRQVTSTATKQDLVISAYKANGGLEERFRLHAGTEDGVWDFVRTHLKNVPLCVVRNNKVEVIAERQTHLLYDRMVAFHVQRLQTIPLSSAEFRLRLAELFSERDDMYFLPEQVTEYDRKRMQAADIETPEFVPTDEVSAIRWLQNKLRTKPQSFQDLHPQFIREIAGWEKSEKPLELSVLLEENFYHYDGKGPVPSQIHSYLSTNFANLRNLQKDDPVLMAKAEDRWCVPDPKDAAQLEQMREKRLLKEFETYKTEKKIKIPRHEAVRAGFKKAWQERDYATIAAVAKKLPGKILEDDPKLLMWYDQATTRMGR